MFNSTMQRVSAVAAAVAVIASGAGTASAAEAHIRAVKPFVNNSIVIQKSIGGFVLGESPLVVRKHFPRKDCQSTACNYTGFGYTVSVQFGTKPGSKRPSVDYVSLAPTTGRDSARSVRTSTGVHLGSTYKQARKGLKRFKYSGTKQKGFFYVMNGNGGVGSTATLFYVVKGVVALIDVQRVDRVG